MNYFSNKDEMGKNNKFRITRGMVILTIVVLAIIAVAVLVIVNIINSKKPEYSLADFNKLEARMIEEAPIYLSQKNIELTSTEIKIDLKDLLEQNGGSIDTNKTKATKVCTGYVIAVKVNKESYSSYIKCKNLYTTTGYVSKGASTTKATTSILKDITKPVITIIGEKEISIPIGTEYKDQGANAIDNIDGDITSLIKSNGTIDTSKLGSYIITYSVSDKSSNKTEEKRKVTVVPGSTTIATTKKVTTTNQNKTTTKRPTTKPKPSSPPTIILFGDKIVTLNVGVGYREPGYSAKDSIGNNITSSVKVNSYINTNVAGTYYLTYTVTDYYGNTSSITRTIIVKRVYIALSGISLSPNAIDLSIGESRSLTVFFNPTNATNKSVSWNSSNPSVTTVSNGMIYARTRGTAIIMVNGADGKSASARVTVK